MKQNLYRETESVMMVREAATFRLFKILRRVGDRRVVLECKAHLDEMDQDPTYVPLDISVAKMLGR